MAAIAISSFRASKARPGIHGLYWIPAFAGMTEGTSQSIFFKRTVGAFYAPLPEMNGAWKAPYTEIFPFLKK
jgi:hypothetical protein